MYLNVHINYKLCLSLNNKCELKNKHKIIKIHVIKIMSKSTWNFWLQVPYILVKFENMIEYYFTCYIYQFEIIIEKCINCSACTILFIISIIYHMWIMSWSCMMKLVIKSLDFHDWYGILMRQCVINYLCFYLFWRMEWTWE